MNRKRNRRSNRKETQPKPKTKLNSGPDPSLFPARPSKPHARLNPARPSAPGRFPGPARSPAYPASRGPVRPALPLAQQPAEHAPRLSQPGASRPQSPRPLALTPSPTNRARTAEPPSTSRNNRAINSVIPGEPPICGSPPQDHRAALQIAPHASETPSHPASAATQTLTAVSALPGLAAPLLRRGPVAPLHRNPLRAPRWPRHDSRELPVHFCLPIRHE